MKHVYDYMLHVINEYAQMLDFEPAPTGDMVLMCSETFLCQAPEKERLLYDSSMVRMASRCPPCAMESRNKQLIEAFQQQKIKAKSIVQQAESHETTVGDIFP
jgi:hypothetical protein